VSRYDDIQRELTRLRFRQAVATLPPALLVVGLTVFEASSAVSAPLLVVIGLIGVPLMSFIFHQAWKALFADYRRGAVRSSQIAREITALRARIATIFEGYRERRRGEAFKTAYDLAGRSVAQIEEALAIGMFRERREVFVTAFMRAGAAVRVTASIGSPYRCAAADNPARWAEHVERLGCDEVRQYHNHPAHHGATRPSPTDFRTSGSLRRVLGLHGPKLRSLIICWNQLREWKVFEYDANQRHWLCDEFDAAL